jgi:DNA-binding beta-propeller fold protein YncE
MSHSGSRRRPALCAALGWGIVAALAVTAAAPGCRKKETAAPGEAAVPVTPGVTPTLAPNLPPVIRPAAVPGQAAFSGLAEPRGADVDAAGRLWVADFGHSRIAIFDSGGGDLGGWRSGRGNGTFQLQEPASVAIHGTDVYVADTWNGRVQHYTTAGEYRETSVAGLYGPRGVAVGADGTLWITDSGNNRLVRCPGGACGKSPQFLGQAGKGSGDLVSPIGIAVGPSGNVYVADIGNRRIQVLSANGRFTRSIPVADWTGPMEPYLEVDDRENLYASVPTADRVEQLDRTGRIVRRWDSDDQGTKFARPTGLALDRKNSVLYVMNSGSNTIVGLKLRGK